MLRSRFSWITIGYLILAAAFVAGCSMDSIAPMASDTTTPSISAKSTKKEKTTDVSVPDETASTPDYTAGTMTESSTSTPDYASMYEGYSFPPVYFSDTFPADKRSASAYITVADGGEIVVQSEKTAVKLVFPPNSVPHDQTMTLTLVNGYAMDVEVTPSMELDEPAKLKVKGTRLVPDGEIGLFHDEGNGEWTKVANTEVNKDKDGIVEIKANVKILLNHFSRYAFGSRF